MLNRKLAIGAALALVVGLGMATTSWAQTSTATNNVAVSASVSTACTVGGATVAFGAYDPTSGLKKVAPAAGLTVTCTKGASVTIDLNDGLNLNRTMTDGTDSLSYQLYKASDQAAGTACPADPTADAVWGPGGGGTTLTPTTPFISSTAGLTFNICGVIPASQNVGVGNYSDTVTATVNF